VRELAGHLALPQCRKLFTDKILACGAIPVAFRLAMGTRARNRLASLCSGWYHPPTRGCAVRPPAARNQHGSTIVEVLVAVIILSVGLLGLVTTAGLVTGMIGQGQRYTEASVLAAERFEILRAEPCPSAGAGTDTRGAYTVSWQVTEVAGGRGRQFAVTVWVPTGRGTRPAQFTTTQFCP
jgi:Tfp pilus assembly protein PilV